MNSRKVVGLFFKTLFIGGFVSLIASFFVNSAEYMAILKPFDVVELFGLIIWYLLYGLLFSIISQAGFFAYLFINRFGIGLFKRYWPTLQISLIVFVIFDLVYFPYKGDNDIALYLFILMAVAIFAYGFVIAKIKAKETHQRAFVPALFFMVVITTIEWIPGLMTGEVNYALLMILSLLACNTYQLLMLHRLSGTIAGGKPISNKGK